jgi:hypothetical protein
LCIPIRSSRKHAQEFVTFANLTAQAVIRIYTVSGLFVREVWKTDGNGGVEWDLRERGGRGARGRVSVPRQREPTSQGREVEIETR